MTIPFGLSRAQMCIFASLLVYLAPRTFASFKQRGYTFDELSQMLGYIFALVHVIMLTSNVVYFVDWPTRLAFCLLHFALMAANTAAGYLRIRRLSNDWLAVFDAFAPAMLDVACLLIFL